MSSLSLYYLVWLLVGLVLIAVASARLARRLVLRERQRVCAGALADALSRYAAWLAAQRGQLMMEIDREVAQAALQEARDLQAHCFPQLGAWLERMLATDQQLTQWIQRQQGLRHEEPEAWLEMQADQAGQQLLHAQDQTLNEIRRQIAGAMRITVAEGPIRA